MVIIDILKQVFFCHSRRRSTRLVGVVSHLPFRIVLNTASGHYIICHTTLLSRVYRAAAAPSKLMGCDEREKLPSHAGEWKSPRLRVGTERPSWVAAAKGASAAYA